MIVDALRTGLIEGNGRFYPQPRVAIRPHPKYNFDGRIYAVASSEDSVDAAARLGAHMVMFSDRPWPLRLPAIRATANMFRKFHGTEAPPMMIADFCVCWPTLAEAEELARRYMGTFVHSNFEHYELLGEHFAQVKGYDAYAQKAEIARKGGMDGAIDGFMKAAVWGPPDRVLRELESATRGDRRIRAGHRVPLRRHPIRNGGGVAATVRQGSAAGAEDVDQRSDRQRSGVAVTRRWHCIRQRRPQRWRHGARARYRQRRHPGADAAKGAIGQDPRTAGIQPDRGGAVSPHGEAVDQRRPRPGAQPARRLRRHDHRRLAATIGMRRATYQQRALGARQGPQHAGFLVAGDRAVRRLPLGRNWQEPGSAQ